MTETDKPAQFVRRPTVFEAMKWDGEYETVKKINGWLDRYVGFNWDSRHPEATQIHIYLDSEVKLSATVGEWIIKDRGVIKVISDDNLQRLYAPAGVLLLPPEPTPIVEESPQSCLARKVKEARESGSSSLVVVAPRGHGKTHILLEEMLRDPNAVFVAPSSVAAENAFEQYMELCRAQRPDPGMFEYAAERARFIAWHDRAKQAGRNPRRRYLIDNVDYILSINGTPPSMITLSDQS